MTGAPLGKKSGLLIPSKMISQRYRIICIRVQLRVLQSQIHQLKQVKPLILHSTFLNNKLIDWEFEQIPDMIPILSFHWELSWIVIQELLKRVKFLVLLKFSLQRMRKCQSITFFSSTKYHVGWIAVSICVYFCS